MVETIKSEKQIKVAVAVKLIAYRNSKGLNQEQMASLLNIKRPAYSKYEEQYCKPPLGLMQKICELLGLSSIDELIT